ncbi:MAG: tetratricopeptide repeat protein, partial [Gammaproteobacteria bacterium]|nr:tetratricopeptide repeat protein [Gammaproteobacteria bacterium]
RADDRVRITAQLIDASADTHVWAEHYDRELADVFAVQDDITHAIVAAIAPEYLSAEKRRAARKPARNLDAWDNFIRAYFHLSRFTRADHEAGIEAINRAIELDPLGAGHHALLAVLQTMLAFYGWGRSRAEVRHKAREAAEVALGLDDRDALVLRAMGMVNMYERRTEEAVHYFERAVEIDPHEAENYALIGNALGLAGDYEGAVERVEQALKLSPRDTFMSTWYNHLAMAAVAANRDADAESWARATIERGPPGFPGGYRTLAVALAHLDRIEEARGALARLRELLPDVSVAELREALPITHPEHLERYLDGLKKAGLV